MEILYEDNYVIVVIKPEGVLSQEDKDGKESMITLLKSYTDGKVFPLHRLDRETGGVMVFAKTNTAAATLSKDIAEQKLSKEYLALVHGIPEKNEDTYTDLLFRDSRKNKSYVVNRERKGVKKAELSYSLVDKTVINSEECSLVRIKLKTGRTHQIRVQFSYRKMPLLGDKKYGGKDNFNSLGLWAYSLSFNHPKSGERLTFSCSPQNIIKKYFTI